MMRKFLKAVCLLLSAVICLGMFTSCGKGKNIVAIYDGGNKFVYRSDVEDIINYYVTAYSREGMSTSEKNAIRANAVDAFVQYLLIEEDLKEDGFEIDKKTLNERYKIEKANIEEKFDGGYKAWRKFYNVSRSFLKEEVRRTLLNEKCYEDIKSGITITDEVLKEYMNDHALDYFNPSGYHFTMVFREVKNISDENECAAAKAEAQEYIRKIHAGEMTLDQVKTELLGKYTREDGYLNIVVFDDFIAGQSMPKLDTKEQLDDMLKKYDEDYKDRDSKAAPSSKEYERYLEYVGKCTEIETYYALQHLEVNQIYENAIFGFNGYGILVLDSVEKESSFDSFEDVKAELEERYIKDKTETSFNDYVNELYTESSVMNVYKVVPVK